MTIATLCTRDVVHIESLESVAEAARLMREHHVGSVVIVEHDQSRMRPVGMITDRDIAVGVVALGLDPERTPVVRVMGTGVVSIGGDEGVERALSRMRSEGVRRLPVVDADGALVGIVSADDLIELFAEETGFGRVLARGLVRERALRPERPHGLPESVAEKY